MTININGEPKDFPSHNTLTVTQLIQELELGPQPVLVEHNGTAIFERDFPETQVEDGHQLEIIRMVAGG